MNLQSNAIKFTREGGFVRIICEFIEKSSSSKNISRTDFRYKYDFSSGESENRVSDNDENLDQAKMNLKYKLNQVYDPDP